MSTASIQRYQRILDGAPRRGEAVCRTVVQPSGRTVDAGGAARALGIEPAALRSVDVRTWLAADTGGGLVCFDQVGPAVAVTELHSLLAVEPDLLARLSANARVTAAGWAADGASVFVLAVDGEVVGSLDGADPRLRGGPHSGHLDGAARVLRAAAPDSSPQAGLLAAVEEGTGVALDDGWWDEPHPGVAIPTGSSRPTGAVLLDDTDPELATLMRATPDADRQTVFRWLVSRLAAAFGLWAEPAVGVVVDALKDGFPTHDLYAQAMVPLRERLEAEYRRTGLSGLGPERPLWRRVHAATAIELAAVPWVAGADPLRALYHARLALFDQWPGVVAAIRAMVGEAS